MRPPKQIKDSIEQLIKLSPEKNLKKQLMFTLQTITKHVMHEPVILVCYRLSYEHSTVSEWIDKKGTNPGIILHLGRRCRAPGLQGIPSVACSC